MHARDLTPGRGSVLTTAPPTVRIDRTAFLADFGMLFQGGALFDSPDGLAERPSACATDAPVEPAAKARARHRQLARVDWGPRPPISIPPKSRAACKSALGGAPSPPIRCDLLRRADRRAPRPDHGGVINDLIRELVTEMGATAVTITHDMTMVRTVADRVAMLHDGLGALARPSLQMDDATDPYRPVHPWSRHLGRRRRTMGEGGDPSMDGNTGGCLCGDVRLVARAPYRVGSAIASTAAITARCSMPRRIFPEGAS